MSTLDELRRIHRLADKARKEADAGLNVTAWHGWPAFYAATQRIHLAAHRYDMQRSLKHFDALVAAVRATEETH